jgi:hypothetical protein
LIGIISFAVTFINPVGGHLWETSFGFVGNRYLVSHTQEYLPPFFHDPSTWPFLIMLTLIIFALGVKVKRLPFAQILLLSGWSAMALYSARNIPLFAIVTAPILSTIVTGLFSETSRWQKLEKNIFHTDQKLRGGVWVVVYTLLILVFLSTPTAQNYNTYDESIFPVEAIDWLEENPQDGNIFNHFPWGGYLLYRQWPGLLVFIDGQTDFYGEELTREYEQVITLDENWEQVLEKYQVDWFLIPQNSILADALSENSGWQTLYTDHTALIFKRNK